MLQIDGRWLVAPDLKYRSARNRQGLVHAAPELVTMGSWNLKHLSFVKPCAAKRWSWLELTPYGDHCAQGQRQHFLQTMGNQIVKNCSSTEANYWSPQNNANAPCHFFNYTGQLPKVRLIEALKYFKENGVRILFVILPTKDVTTYAIVKKVADVDVGIHTTCIVRYPDCRPGMTEPGPMGKIYPIRQLKCDPGAALNVLHKVNLRLGGGNLLLGCHRNGEGRLFTRGAMILGADVTHPGVGSMKKCPSVAAVIGSFVPQFNLYCASVCCQTSKRESIEAFGHMMGERLDLWKDKNASKYQARGARYPKQIVIFRDVIESQFQMI